MYFFQASHLGLVIFNHPPDRFFHDLFPSVLNHTGVQIKAFVRNQPLNTVAVDYPAERVKNSDPIAANSYPYGCLDEQSTKDDSQLETVTFPSGKISKKLN